MKHAYRTDIVLGERYRDDQTGIEGHVTAVTFYQHGCERATIEAVVAGKIEEYGFDAPRLTRVSTGIRVVTEQVGGPERVSTRRPGPVSR